MTLTVRKRAVGSIALFLGAVAGDPSGGASSFRPETYEAFVSARTYADLSEAIESERFLYLPPGHYEVDNPIVVERSEALFLHGANRRHSRIVAKNPSKPLFIVKRAGLVNFANLSLWPAPPEDAWDARALIALNEEPVRIEIQDCTVDEGVLEFKGPGRFQLQGTNFYPRGATRAALRVDHPGANVVMIGGNISNLGQPPRAPTAEQFHVWQKRGRLQIFGTGMQAALGIADVRIDAPSTNGPHVLAAVRSEGSNGANQGKHPSTLVYVPPTTEPIDLLLLSNGGSWHGSGRGSGRFVDYNGAGTVWLIGNNGSYGAGSLVVGEAPAATLVAIGNLEYSDRRVLSDRAQKQFALANLYPHRFRTGKKEPPYFRFVQEPSPRPETLPEPPPVTVPEPIPRPRLTRPLPGMLNARSYGAVGDGEHDDTKALQKALDAGCGKRGGKILFVPPGHYRITKRLLYNHRERGCTAHQPGGWIAGAGSDRTVLAREGAGGVFASEGLSHITVQGLTFRSEPYGTGETSGQPAFALENAEPGAASQEVVFYDVVFEGGYAGLGIGLRSSGNCSENLIVNSEFRNARYGLAVGSFNALNNLVYRGRFRGNATAIGHPADTRNGGTWAVLGAHVRDVRRNLLEMRGSASGIWYLQGLDAETSRLVETGVTGAAYPLLFDGSLIRPPVADGRVRVEFKATAGPIFLHSRVYSLSEHFPTPLSSSYLLDLFSEIDLSEANEPGARFRRETLAAP